MGAEAGALTPILLIIFAVLFIIILGILIAVFWVWMLIDCITRDFRDDMEKIVWILLMVFLGVIASIVYYFVVKRNDKGKKRNH